MNIKTICISNKNELLPLREEIESLFQSSFGERQIGAVWDWAYINNPNGDPIVTICYDGDRLIGHYAIVPMPLSSGAHKKNSYISMTTMVAEPYRKYGLFTMLAKTTYDMAISKEIDFVFGFPNKQSTPGFRKRLNWSLPETDYVATVCKAELLSKVNSGFFDKTGLFGLELKDPVIRTWRLSRPGATYTFENGLALKHHNNSIDLLWWEDWASLEAIPSDSPINVLVSATSGLEPNRQFDYQFGGISLHSTFKPTAINREMAISDLF